MVLVKTPAGQEALKDRHGSLSSRQRSAFILFDGKRTTGEILAATAAMGITQDDVQAMIAQGLLAPVGGRCLRLRQARWLAKPPLRWQRLLPPIWARWRRRLKARDALPWSATRRPIPSRPS